jgi:hypothetical protein
MRRDTKKPTLSPRSKPRTTRRGRTSTSNANALVPEPAHSTRPTRPDLRELANSVAGAEARGQFSITAVQGIHADVVSGSIDTVYKRARRNSPPIQLVTTTRDEITIAIRGAQLTLKRDDALALAELIAATFGR